MKIDELPKELIEKIEPHYKKISNQTFKNSFSAYELQEAKQIFKQHKNSSDAHRSILGLLRSHPRHEKKRETNQGS